jgi:hypothetical protein
MKFLSRWLVLLTSHISLVTSFSLALLLLYTPSSAFAQWEPDVRLTYNDSSSVTTTEGGSNRCIAAGPGANVHVVWVDGMDGQLRVYYKRSTDAGVSWAPDVRLSDTLSLVDYPSISISGPTVHVVWFDRRDGHREIYYKRSSDSGMTWSPDTRLTHGTSPSYDPSVSASDSLVYVTWVYYPFDNIPEIYYKRSLDGGMTWSPDTCLSNDTTYSAWPSVSSSGSMVHIAWRDTKNGSRQILYLRSTDSGRTWAADTQLTNTPAWSSMYPSISASGSDVHVTWEDRRNGNEEIYYKRSTDGGILWSPDTRLTNNASYSTDPHLATSGSNVHVVWWDYRNGGGEIYYLYSSDGGTSWSGETRLTQNDSTSQYASVATQGSAVHVVWMDTRDGNSEIYYKRNPTGNIGVEEYARVRDQGFGFRITARPNPFTSFARVSGHEAERFALYDIFGQKVGVYKGDRVGEGLAAGVYFLKPEGKDAKPLRIIKLR